MREVKHMQKLKKNWKQIFISIVIIVICAIFVREKYCYKSLFSKEFCENVKEIQYIDDYENKVYTITDEEMIDEFMTVLSVNRYKRMPGAVNEGGYAFKIITDEKEYGVCLAGNEVDWKRKQYEPKDQEAIGKLLKTVWQYWGIE